MVSLEDLLRRDVNVFSIVREVEDHCDNAASRCASAEKTYLPGLEALIAKAEQKARDLGVDHKSTMVKLTVTGAWLIVNGAVVLLSTPTDLRLAALTGVALALGEARTRLGQKGTKSITELRAIAARLRAWIQDVRASAKKLNVSITTNRELVGYTDASGRPAVKSTTDMSSSEQKEFSRTFKARISSLVAVDNKLLADLRRADQAVN